MSIPSITIFVRHSVKCPKRADELYRSCKCPKHLRWSHGGRQERRSAGTRSWSLAEEAKRKLEARFGSATSDTSKAAVYLSLEIETATTLNRAIELFVIDKRSQGLDASVLKKYERELRRLAEFMSKRNRHFPHEIGLEDLTEFKAGWATQYPSSTTRVKVQERLRALLRYCYELRLIDRVPQLSAIKVDEPPTMPLTSCLQITSLSD